MTDTPVAPEPTFDTPEPNFDSGNLPDTGWSSYIKVVPTSMHRVDGPFTVATSEGPLHCEDGYLAVDARGYPYPIAATEHALIYEPVSDTNMPKVRVDGQLGKRTVRVNGRPLPGVESYSLTEHARADGSGRLQHVAVTIATDDAEITE